MKLVTDAEEFREMEAVVALGVFDGVHVGHQKLLAEACRLKIDEGLPLIVLTFYPHPRTVTGSPDRYSCLLTPPQEKAYLMEEAGADYLWTVPFTQELATMTPADFVDVYLTGRLRTKIAVCGFNFSFGYRGAGKAEDLKEFGRMRGFSVSVVPPMTADGEIVSSSRIREYLKQGYVEQAAVFLGRPYCLFGRVVRGDGRGRTLGIPTCNLEVPGNKLIPLNGVYAAFVRATIPGEVSGPGSGGLLGGRMAVVNIGTRPTFGGKDVRVEVHVPGLSGDLYGAFMQVFLTRYLRPEKKFEDASALCAQIAEDVRSALAGAHSFTLPAAYDKMLSTQVP